IQNPRNVKLLPGSMAWHELKRYPNAAQSLRRGLQRGRLAHAYLIAGDSMESLEQIARTLAKTLNCLQPPERGETGTALDCCDQCVSCRKIDHFNHPDILWVRAESKSRQ